MHKSSNIIKGRSPSIKLKEKNKPKYEYVQPLAQKIPGNHLYKVQTQEKKSNKDLEIFDKELHSKNDYISYFGIEVSVMNLRPQTNLKEREKPEKGNGNSPISKSQIRNDPYIKKPQTSHGQKFNTGRDLYRSSGLDLSIYPQSNQKMYLYLQLIMIYSLPQGDYK